MKHMNREQFLNLSATETAKIVRAIAGPQVCVFPINGTRRWFLLEHGDAIQDDPVKAYLDITSKKHIEIYKLCFSHGLDTLVTPVFGGELFNRGDEYIKMAIDGMSRLAVHPDFLSFYQKHKVRVHFYGDYHKQLAGTPYAYLSDMFDRISEHTAHHNRYRLFYGVFAATEATESIAELTLHFYQNANRLPTRRELIELYYGEYIEKANIFIGFEKFNVFDYPLLGWGEESLYFTVAPSLYLNERQLRNILYDHVYLRPVQDPDYMTMPEQDFEAMRTYYQKNRETTFGIGEMRGGIWYPLPQPGITSDPAKE
jgi:tuberculosinol/isotuberculosinol synthase